MCDVPSRDESSGGAGSVLRGVSPCFGWMRGMSVCRWADCWCKAWPPVRLIVSTGDYYTVEEIEPEGAVRRFRYAYRRESA